MQNQNRTTDSVFAHMLDILRYPRRVALRHNLNHHSTRETHVRRVACRFFMIKTLYIIKSTNKQFKIYRVYKKIVNMLLSSYGANLLPYKLYMFYKYIHTYILYVCRCVYFIGNCQGAIFKISYELFSACYVFTF